MSSDSYGWLKVLKSGDEVAIDTGWSDFSIERVATVTSTQIVLSRNRRFNRSDGRLRGSSGYHSNYLHELTDELRSKIAYSKAVDFLRSTDWRQVPRETVMRIADALRVESALK